MAAVVAQPFPSRPVGTLFRHVLVSELTLCESVEKVIEAFPSGTRPGAGVGTVGAATG
jgi:hypothetical protein